MSRRGTGMNRGVNFRRAAVFGIVLLSACDALDDLVSSAIVESVDVSPDSATVRVGEGIQMVAVLRDGIDTTLVRKPTWSSLDPVTIAVDSAGWVTGLRTGSGRVRAEADGRVDVARIRVVP